MTTMCPHYEADPSFQIRDGGSTGPYDCTAHSTSDAIDHATCGAKDPGGRTIRLQSSEPVPDPKSPGLNLQQVQRVALIHYNVYLEVHTGINAVGWTTYEARRADGQGVIIQLSYGPIADSPYDAFDSRFRGGHAMFETVHATYDPGADGRRPGIWKYDGRVYPRDLMKRAAGALVIGTTSTGAVKKVGYGKVWCAFTRDVIPDYHVVIRPSDRFFRYFVKDGIIVDRSDRIEGRSTSARCTVPLSRYWPRSQGGTGKSYSLVRIVDSGSSYHGWYVSSRYAREI